MDSFIKCNASSRGPGIGRSSPPTARALLYLIFFLVFLFTALHHIPVDDGLRHIGLASGESRSWGEVYPHSRFADASGISPWFGFDLSLRYLMKLFNALEIEPLASKLLLLKVLMFSIGCGTFLLLIRKSNIADEITNAQSLGWVVALAVLFLSQSIYRCIMVRPFIFGTLFLVSTIGARGFVAGGASCAMLTFFYPYLSWFYILPAVVGHAVRGSRRFAVGALLFLGCFLLLQPPEFWNLQKALFESGRIRGLMNTSITELAFSFSHFFTIFYGCLILAAYPFFSPGARKLTYPCLLVLFYLPPSALYVRTFLDVFLPLTFVAFGRELFTVLKNFVAIVASAWHNCIRIVAPGLMRGFFARNRKPNPARNQSILFRLSLAFGFLTLIYLSFVSVKGQWNEFKAMEASLSSLPPGVTVLTSFNQQYRVLFLRPDLRLIPSSEIGFPTAAVEDAYVRFFKAGSFKQLAEQTGAAFLVEGQDMYIDPAEAKFLEPVSSDTHLRVWKIN